ncbi:7,8-didemethyl-8-hydroxy-5-deazariboflavin synthase, partial [Microbacterium sp. zg.Y909]|nr:7,8-didemethyl-8-hydroxy-5-deazariboflavin synthase [Microbacterium sp. zg.Y909]
SDPTEFALLVRAGADDWGGVSPVTADHVNPERPWPHLDDLARRTADLGFTLRERLTAHPEYIHRADEWLDPAMHAPVTALADPMSGLAAVASAEAGGSASRKTPPEPASHAPEQPAGASAPGAPARNSSKTDPSAPSAADSAPHAQDSRSYARRGAGTTIARLAEEAAGDPLSLGDDDWTRLLLATGTDLESVVATADDVRRYTVGEAVSLVVNRNLTSSGFRS